MPAKGVGGMQSGRSNGLNADGSLMNVGNKLSDRPSIRLFTQYSSSSQMEQALSDDWIYGAEPAEAARPPTRRTQRTRKRRTRTRHCLGNWATPPGRRGGPWPRGPVS